MYTLFTTAGETTTTCYYTPSSVTFITITSNFSGDRLLFVKFFMKEVCNGIPFLQVI